MENKVKGYKAFNADLTNRYGVFFEEGKKYFVNGPAVFGNYGNGFHFCERLEDTLRYFDALEGNAMFAEVIGSGSVVKRNDEFYGYYDMYVATELEIVKFLSKKEIIHMFENVAWYRAIRFVQGFKLTSEELELFKLFYKNERSVLQAIAYYQEGQKGIYENDENDMYMKKLNFKVKN